jgi:hypothetical protein
MTKTIRKNTKAYDAAISDAKNVLGYSESNYFNGTPVVLPFSQFVLDNAKLVQRGDKFSLTVHSNWWYEFTN